MYILQQFHLNTCLFLALKSANIVSREYAWPSRPIPSAFNGISRGRVSEVPLAIAFNRNYFIGGSSRELQSRTRASYGRTDERTNARANLLPLPLAHRIPS